MQDKKALLEPDFTYHVYNRANGNDRLFSSTENYHFFMERYWRYVEPVADTFCYCLMPNHFHFLVRIKAEQELLQFFRKGKSKDLTGFQNLSGLLSRRFSNFLNSYAKAYNRQQHRQGSLFIRPFKRKKITYEKYLLKLVHYIHYNPVEAGLADQPEDWNFSSYAAIIYGKQSPVKREEVLGWFGDLENLIHCHKYPPEVSGIDDF